MEQSSNHSINPMTMATKPRFLSYHDGDFEICNITMYFDTHRNMSKQITHNIFECTMILRKGRW